VAQAAGTGVGAQAVELLITALVVCVVGAKHVRGKWRSRPGSYLP
jgi:hypothetical protein